MKTAPIAILPVRTAVSRVACEFPAGTILRLKATGDLYTMGKKAGLSSFHVIRHKDELAHTQHANRLIMAFERVDKSQIGAR